MGNGKPGRPVLSFVKKHIKFGMTSIAPESLIPPSMIADLTDWKHSETTRYLCASAHMLSGFRDHVIRKFIDEKYRAIAVSYGTDMATVLKHCLAARRDSRIRNWILASMILLAYIGIYFSITTESTTGLTFTAILYILLGGGVIFVARMLRQELLRE